jgi:hypothetical protein
MKATSFALSRLVATLALASTSASGQLLPQLEATTSGAWGSSNTCGSFAGGLTAAARFAARRNVQLDLSGAVGATERGCDRSSVSGSGAARASFGTRSTRWWVEYGVAQSGTLDTLVRHVGPSIGATHRLGPSFLSLSFGSRRDRTALRQSIEWVDVSGQIIPLDPDHHIPVTVTVLDTVNRALNRSAPDIGFSISWAHRAFSVVAVTRAALGSGLGRTDPFGHVRMSVAVASRVAIVSSLVARSSVPALEIPALRMATLGLLVRPYATDRKDESLASRGSALEFRSASAGDGRVTIAVRAPRARHVEVAGDFSNWTSIALVQERDGWWRASTDAAPGSHQISVRVDGGAWRAPPGLPPVRDEFGATVGLLVVR